MSDYDSHSLADTESANSDSDMSTSDGGLIEFTTSGMSCGEDDNDIERTKSNKDDLEIEALRLAGWVPLEG
jgi:hypothetical protein